VENFQGMIKEMQRNAALSVMQVRAGQATRGIPPTHYYAQGCHALALMPCTVHYTTVLYGTYCAQGSACAPCRWRMRRSCGGP